MRVGLSSVKKKYGDRIILDIDEFEFESGKIYAVIGPNGAGKSTMLRIMAGLDKADCGKILYEGSEKKTSDNIAFMPQKPYIFDITVLENVIMGIKRGSNALECAKEALLYVGMSGFENAKARSLSGGEAQRAAVARTLVLRKDLVLLDEPASSADISSMRLIEDYVKMVNKRYGSTIIFNTHNPSQALRIANHIIILWDGRIIEYGSPSVIFSSPCRPETKEFLQNWRI